MSRPFETTLRAWIARLIGTALAVAAAYGAWLLVGEIRGLVRGLPADIARPITVLQYPLAGLALILVPSLLRPVIDRGLTLLGHPSPDQSPED